ncbi:hypothetical protein [Bacillus sp. JJ1562]|uniref:hypothetical protein n=1 Tax=Bacillus sp. JJ1562 TaxID=3122960 RepID=UPI0030022FED
MKNSMRFLIISLISIIIILILSIWYFLAPLAAKDVLTGFKEVNKIQFGYYTNGNEPFEVYDTDIIDQSDLELILNKFNNTNYNRRFGYKNISNDGQYISMVVFYGKENKNYTLEINDTGFIVVNHKTYKLTDKHKKVFKQVYESIMSVQEDN